MGWLHSACRQSINVAYGHQGIRLASNPAPSPSVCGRQHRLPSHWERLHLRPSCSRCTKSNCKICKTAHQNSIDDGRTRPIMNESSPNLSLVPTSCCSLLPPSPQPGWLKKKPMGDLFASGAASVENSKKQLPLLALIRRSPILWQIHLPPRNSIHSM